MRERDESAPVPLISVVVPVYNVAQYLDQCLSSLFRQGVGGTSLEVLLIDDGSTDGSLLIAKKWERLKSEVRVIRQPNRGLSVARNTGLDAARGEFLTFVDSDDIVPDGVYLEMVQRLVESGSDFITSAPYRFAGWDRHAKPFNRNADLFSRSRIGLDFPSHPEYIRDFTAWNKIYRRTFFVRTGVRFPEGRIYEDVATSPLLYLRSRKFDVYGQPGYFWRITPGGITQTIVSTKAFDRLSAMKSIQESFANAKLSTPVIEALNFALIDYNLRWIFLEYHRFDERTRAHILDSASDLLLDVSFETISRVQHPLSVWTVLAKQGQHDILDPILSDAPTLPDDPVEELYSPYAGGDGQEEQVGVAGPTAVRKRSLGKLAWQVASRSRGWWSQRESLKRRIKNVLLYRGLRPLVFKLPLLKETAVFSAYWGRKFSLSDGPAAVFEELMRRRPDFQAVVLASPERRPTIEQSVRELSGGAANVRVVRSNSFQAHYYLWRAKYLFNDVNFQLGYRFDRYIEKRVGQVEVQTTHGVPIKKMGLDSDVAIAASERQVFLERSRRYDYLVSTSPEVAKRFAESHGVSPRILDTGLPQHDRLFSNPETADVRGLKMSYGVDLEKKIALYAPTFRNDSGSIFPYLIDFDDLRRRLGNSFQLIIKPHPFNHTQLALVDFASMTDFAREPDSTPFIKLMGEVRWDPDYIAATVDHEASRSKDAVHHVHGAVHELLQLADVVITDYSSLMFSYVHLRKPLILFTPDIEAYDSNRGSYFSVDEVAPGAVAKTTEELADAMRLATSELAWNERYDAKRERFIERFLKWEVGGASGKIVEALGLFSYDGSAS